jgi:hypothetical protein
MAYLQFFIDGICAHRQLRSSDYFLEFLKVSSADQWKNKKNEMDKRLTSISGFRDGVAKKLTGNVKADLKAFSNLNGEVTSRISGKMKEYSVALDELVNLIGPLTERLEQHCGQLLIDFNQVNNTLGRMANCALKMKGAHDNFAKKVEFGKTKTSSDIYESLANTLKQWGSMMKEQIKVVENHMIRSFDLTKMELEAHKEV